MPKKQTQTSPEPSPHDSIKLKALRAAFCDNCEGRIFAHDLSLSIDYCHYRRTNDHAALGHVLSTIERPVSAHIRHRHGDLRFAARSVEDISQLTLLKLCTTESPFDCTKNFYSWVFTIADRVVLDVWRKDMRHRKALQSWLVRVAEADESRWFENELIASRCFQPLEASIERENASRLAELLPRLHITDQVIVVMRLNGKKYREIGDAVNLKVPAVKRRIDRSVYRLNQWLQEPE